MVASHGRFSSFLIILVAVSAIMGCGDDEPTSTIEDAAGDLDSDAAGDLGAVDQSELSDDADLQAPPPAIEFLSITESPDSALAALIEVETNEPTYATIEAVAGEHRIDVPTTDLDEAHTILLMGMRFGMTYDVTVEVTNAAGTAASEVEQFVTTPRPDDFPIVEVLVSDPERYQPGVTLFALRKTVNGTRDGRFGMFVVVDMEGYVIWYQNHGGYTGTAYMLDNGNLLYQAGGGAFEATVSGEMVHSWVKSELNPPLAFIHHDVMKMPNGNILTLNSEMRIVDGYPDPEGGEETLTYNVVGDGVAEITPGGDVVNLWWHHDHLADYVHKEGPMFDHPGKDAWFPDAEGGTKDWTHSNGVQYDAENDLYLVSVRHLDWIIAIERETGELVWRLGCGGDFQLTNGSGEIIDGCDPAWFYHPHSPKLEEDGTILIYDNGNFRPGTERFGEGESAAYSRAVRYSLDMPDDNRDNWTATIEWEFVNPTLPNYCDFAGGVDLLDNGNVLIADPALIRDYPIENPPRNQDMARIAEVTGDAEAEKVWEILIHNDWEGGEEPRLGWTIYRADRMPGLYGPVTGDEE